MSGILSAVVVLCSASCGGNAEASGGSHIGAPRTRFKYKILADYEDDKKDSYLESDNCVLIPVENKPAINPIPHEDIGYKNKAATAADRFFLMFGYAVMFIFDGILDFQQNLKYWQR